MQLLVSVADAIDAREALAGGADIIDAKDPSRGALGAVTIDCFRRVAEVVGRDRPLSAALDDADDWSAVWRNAAIFATAGASFVKVAVDSASSFGSAGLKAGRYNEEKTGSGGCRRRASARRPAGLRIVVAAYADVPRQADTIFDIAVRAGAAGVLLDTADKTAAGLCGLMTARAIERWIAHAHAHGLFAAVAGRLTVDDLLPVRDLGADIAGVRGAACAGGRTGRITAARVRALCEKLGQRGDPIDRDDVDAKRALATGA